MAGYVNRYSNFKFPPYKKVDFPKMLYQPKTATVGVEVADEKGIVRLTRLEKPIIETMNATNLEQYREMLAEGWIDGFKRALIEARKLPNEGKDVIRVVSGEHLREVTPQEFELVAETDSELSMDPDKEILEAEPQAIELAKAEKKPRGRPKGKTAIRSEKQSAA